MAVAVVHKKQTPEGATATLTITKPTKDNWLVVFVNQKASKTAPSLAGFSLISETHAEQNSENTIWAFWKKAAGTEEVLAPTASGAGTIQGLNCIEISGLGASPTLDGIAHSDNKATNFFIGLTGLTTTDASDIVLFSFQMSLGSGTINAYSAEGAPTPTIYESTGSRNGGAWLIPGETIQATDVFAANWTSSRTNAGICLAIKPTSVSASVTCGDTISVSDSATLSSALARTCGDTVAVSDAASRQSTLARSCNDSVGVSDSASAHTSIVRSCAESVSVSDAASAGRIFARTAADTISVSDQAGRSSATARSAGDVVSIAGSAVRSFSQARTAQATITLSDGATGLPAMARSVACTIALSSTVQGVVEHVDLRRPRHVSVTNPLPIYVTVTGPSTIAVVVSNPTPIVVAISEP